mgnify:CR=1 FL=1
MAKKIIEKIGFIFRWTRRLESPLYIFNFFLSLALLTAGIFFYRYQERAAQETVERQLTTLAELKAKQINGWLEERLADAFNLAESPFFVTEISNYLKKPDEILKARILKRLKITAEAYNYADILVLDKEKKVRLSLTSPESSLSPECLKILELAEQSQKPVFSELHRETPEGPIHLDVAAVLVPSTQEETQEKDNQDKRIEHAGFILLKVNAESFLFPLIQSWPLPSQTAETLLVRREGEEVVFLNELRHHQETALTLKFPVTRKELPSVRAVLGEKGFVEGKDYRGMDVLAFISPVPHTNWFMVTKIDRSEALGPWRTRSILILLVSIGILSLPIGLSEVLWQRREKSHYRKLYEAEARARESEEMFRILNESSLAGVYLIQDGLLRYVNQAAADLFGYTPEELIDKESPLVVVHPRDKALVAENIRRRIAGEIKSLRYEFLGQRKDGSTLNVEVHGSVINYRGKPAIIGNLIDITERKKLLEEVQKREAELRSTLYSIGDGVIVTDTEGRIIMMNPVAEKLTGWKEEEAKGEPIQKVFHIINELTREPAENPVERVIREGIIVGLANHSVLISREGKEYPVADSGAPIKGPEGSLIGVVLVFRDQTEARLAQRRLEEAKELAESIVETIHNPLVVLDPEFKIIEANRAFTLTFQVREEEILHRSFLEIEDGLWNIPELRRHLEQILPQNRTFEDLEIEIDSRKTGHRILLLNGRRLYHEKNRTRLILLAMEDITARRQAEEALRKSERDMSVILSGISEHIVYQAPDHTIIWANRAAAQSLGMKPEDLVGRRCYELWHGRSTPCEICPVARARETGKPQEDQVKTPDDRYWYIRGYPVLDEKGQVAALIEVTLEITETVKAQLDLKASEERYRRLAENAQDIIYRYRFYPERGFEYVNPAATVITGYTPEEHYADPDLGFKIVVEEDRPLLEKMSTAEISQPVVLRWRRRDGEIIWTEQRNVPIYDEEGRLVALEGIVRDVTERIKREEALKKSLKEKEILLREIHHRVKNNMQVISSLLNLQAALMDDPKIKEIFKQCQKRIRSMAQVHEKLYASPDLTAIDFADYIQSLAKTIYQEYEWQLGQIELKTKLEPIAININQAVPLGLIVNELITNSLKHAFPERRKGTIWIVLKRLDEKRAWLQVKDDGVGLPEGIDLKKPKTMGLIIIEALVEQLEAKMEIIREGGTDIRLTFPLSP